MLETNNYSAFGLLQYTFFRKLKIQTGLRYDNKSVSTQSIGAAGRSVKHTVRQLIKIMAVSAVHWAQPLTIPNFFYSGQILLQLTGHQTWLSLLQMVLMN